METDRIFMVILLVLAVAGIILGAVALTKKCDTAHKEGLFVGSSSSEFSSCAGTVVPIGTILPFYAMNGDKFDRTRIPDGWVICDGRTHGVPDLRNKYLMGSDADSNFTANVNGGKPFNLKLNSENLPSHTHSYNEYTSNLYAVGAPLGGGAPYPNPARRDEREYRGHGGRYKYSNSNWRLYQ